MESNMGFWTFVGKKCPSLTMTADEQYFIKMVLAFFAASDGIT
jgi:hypothetical protein